MALTPGTRLGVYEITAQIGEGGMGQVYRGTDTRLKRAVAIKILPPTVAGDADRLARFQREAEVLAALNHPNIAAIHGLEESGGVTALVMELVEGDDLSQRIARGAIPLDEALPIAKQIAAALEAAHEQGIIHRDLKPANVKVRSDGTVKVLDFGLAKAMEPVSALRASAGQALSQSPTITSPAMTQAGMILGTAAYMSPEQARGRPVDKRADIWAFGAVLFEMLTAERLFKGDDIGETLAAVIKGEPSLEAVPAHVRPLLRACLEKDPRKRLRDIGDIGLLLERAPEAAQQPASSRRALLLWPAVAAMLLAATAGFAWLYLRQPPPAQQSLRFQVPPPGSTPAEMLALSPDANYLAFVAADDGPTRLWVRALDTIEARALAGTDGATYPFWSPDGQSLGFFAQGKLKKIAIAGGPPQTLCDATSGRGGTWNREGVIVFSADPSSPILRVSSAGGEATPITRTSGVGGHRFPAFLPDERHFLFTSGSDDPEAVGLFVGSLDGEAPVRLLADVSNGLYAPPVVTGDPGFVLFRREATLMAQPFDAAGMRVAGEMFPVAEEVAQGQNVGFGAFSVAPSGVLAYRAGAAATRELWWMDRTGTRLSSATKPAGIQILYSLSPDEKTLAFRINSGVGTSDLWLQGLERGVTTRFTFRNGIASSPVWSPDGSRVVFSVQDTSTYSSALYQKARGNAGEELLLSTGVNGRADDWSADGAVILYSQQESKTATDLWLLPLEGDRKPVPYLQTPASEQNGRFYPGAAAPRFVAYQSDESGQNQVYIQSIPAGTKFQVSSNGGTNPDWRQDGRELYYLSPDRRLMVVSIAVDPSVQIGAPRELFMNSSMTSYRVSRDGQRFLVNLPAGGESSGVEPVTVVTNWQAGLSR